MTFPCSVQGIKVSCWESEDPSGSVNQINQMTMCLRGKPVTVATSSSSTERVGSEQHRVDEINLSEKFQSIGVGDPKRRASHNWSCVLCRTLGSTSL